MPDESLKKVKDFSEEEKEAILARANKIEITRVAKEFGTTWQVVSAIQRSAKNAARKAAKKTKAAKTGKAPRSSDERRLEILKRASEIGITQAAAEAGVSKWTVFQWRKVMKKAGYDIPRAARVPSTSAAAVKVKAPVTKTAVRANTTKTSLPAKKSGTYSQVEFENEMLKQQVASLSEQVAKLRAALSQLA